MNIEGLKLKNFLKEYRIQEQEFEYAGIKGVAEMFGWNIIFFRKYKQISKTSAISFCEIEDKAITKLANFILENIDIDIKFGDSLEKIRAVYGVSNSIDNTYEDMTRYNYLLNPDLYIVFGLKQDNLVYIDIINDKEIIKEMLSVI